MISRVLNYSDNLSGFRRIVDCIIRQNDDTTPVRRLTHNTTHNTGDERWQL